ncbi:exopolysaccharide transport family protein [Afifella sp. IM 167]|uniref:GumC family protein n=1 Tax=Afifella sp. IM 167 TaxID=2033586 RepID=UPI001CCF297B|nr:exopolysaccharide transport family protein [Afifella sp. IM 167]MBZ8134559.1 chain-length determining protein [Afifella sp. IM 167]
MPDERPMEMDVSAIAAALWRKAWLLVLVALGAGILTYIGLSTVTPLYTGDARVLIDAGDSPLTRPRDAPSENIAVQLDESAISSQVEVVRSRSIANTVIDKFDLTRNPEFDPALDPSLIDTILMATGLRSSPVEATIRQRVLETYYERLSVYPVMKSRVIVVEFTSKDPELAAKITNAIADAFVSLQGEAKMESTSAATEWLQGEIARLRDRVAEAERAVEEYRSGSELFDVKGQGQDETTLQTQQLSDLNAELGRAEAAQSEAQSRAELIRTLLREGGSFDSSEEVLNSQLVQRLRERQVALKAEIADLSASLLPGHPKLQALQSQLADLDRQVRVEVQRILQSLETASRVAGARVESLRQRLNGQKAAVASSNEKSIRLRALQREATAQRDLLETFLGRYREAAARTESNYLPADSRVISRAIPPRNPSWPRKGMLTVAAMFGALFIAMAFIVIREFSTGRAYRPLEAGRVPPAGEVPPEPLLRFGALPAGGTPSLDAAREIPGMTDLASLMASEGVKTVLFAGDGGAFAGDAALAASRLLARNDGLRVILMDIGVEPSPALDRDGGPGLGDLLSGETPFGDAIRLDGDSRVHFIPLGSMEQDPPLQRLSLVVGALRHSYDRVVVVADRYDDWPAEFVTPDLAVLVCAPEADSQARRTLHRSAIDAGARAALVLQRSDEEAPEPQRAEEAA